MRTVACGSLPFLRIGTKPAESWCATAPPRMKPGSVFRDITTLLGDARAFRLAAGIRVDERVDGAAEGARITQERGDVAEHDPGLRIVRNRADGRPKVGDVRLVHPGVTLRTRQKRRRGSYPFSTRPATASSFCSSAGSRASGAVIMAVSSARSEPTGQASC